MLIFYTQPYKKLAQRMMSKLQATEGIVEYATFPDGERYYRIQSSVRGQEVLLLSGAYDNDSLMESYDLACGLIQEGALKLNLIIPYFGYSTMERAVLKGEIVTAKNRARMLSSIPRAAQGNTIYLVDLHTGGLEHYFEGGLEVRHLYAKEIILSAIKDLGGEDFVLGSTDAGRAKWVESLSNDIGVDAAFVYKKRISGDQTSVTAISANVLERNVVIYDDMIRTGGSLIGAAKAYLESGAKSVFAVTTHGLFSKNAIERIKASGVINKITTTDSHPNSTDLIDDCFLIGCSLDNILSEPFLKNEL
ncbi:MAG: ribose-phosphate pyrophosphokinase [Proteobacteria bacterium]|nr:ribose-phosphate pyrophosphokinase [Pseudomonadota bacterium]